MGDHSWLSVERGDRAPLRVFMAFIVVASRFTPRVAAVTGIVSVSGRVSGLQMGAKVCKSRERGGRRGLLVKL